MFPLSFKLSTSSQTYVRHLGRLLAMARASGCDAHEAEDVVQDLFTRLLRVGRLEELNELPEHAQSTVLRRRLKCALTNRWRDRQRLCREARLTVALEDLEEHKWHPAVRVTPATEHDRRWALERIAEALTQLHGECGNQWCEIETALHAGRPPEAAGGTVRVAVCRARKHLRKMLCTDELREALLAAA